MKSHITCKPAPTSASVLRARSKTIRQRGVTAIELIVGLAVIALVIGGAATTAKATFRDQKVNAEAQMLGKLQQKIRTAINTVKITDGITVDYAIKSGWVTPDMVNPAKDAIISKFGGPITIAATSTGRNGAANDVVSLLYTGNLPQAECLDLVKTVAPNFDYVGSSTNWELVKSWRTPNDVPTEANIAAACNSDVDNRPVFSIMK